MNTPIYDFLTQYSSSDTLRCHMPGHKGRSFSGAMHELSRLDITEIKGADSLFEADGIIAQSERNMASLYGSAAAAYSAGGSTLCIQAMLAIMKQEGRTVYAVRNVHRAFLNAAALLGIEVEWIMPEYSGGILSGRIGPETVRRAMSGSKNAALYVTSPDYTGRIADIAALAEVCHDIGARLIVDNAHGAHLAFFERNIHPISLGADMCCDSAHKMLPAFTGASVLHTSRGEYADKLKGAMGLFGSTSPSYLIMASLDLCTQYIDGNIRRDLAENVRLANELRSRFADRLTFADGDPLHITVKACENGYDGTELAELLRENGVECEYADSELMVLLMSPMSVAEDYERLENALDRALCSAKRNQPCRNMGIEMKLPKKAMSIREAVFSPSEEIPVEKAEGRVCATVNVPCPPAVPIAASGEIIDRGCINIFKRYGIPVVNVVKL